MTEIALAADAPAEDASVFLRLGAPGKNGHNSSMEPFMVAAQADSATGAPRINVESYISELQLPASLAALYRLIGNPKQEYIFNHWILMSLDFVRDRTRHLRTEHNQGDVVDFAFCYAGMGHAVVCSYAPSLGQVFYRVDGGPNGYERDDAFKALVAYRPRGGPTFFEVGHLFQTVKEQIGQQAYEPFNLQLTHLT